MTPARPAWRPRPQPRQATGLVAEGAAAIAAARAVLRWPEERRERLTWQVVGEVLVVLGDAAALPWADGVQYVGQAPGSALLLPTTLEPSIHPSLLARAAAVSGPAAVQVASGGAVRLVVVDATSSDVAALEALAAEPGGSP